MYENQKSTVLAVDNMNGAEVVGRIVRVSFNQGDSYVLTTRSITVAVTSNQRKRTLKANGCFPMSRRTMLFPRLLKVSSDCQSVLADRPSV